MLYKRTSSLYIYIGMLTLCFALHLDAASGDWTSFVSGYAQSAWNALPSREQVLKSVNPFQMSSEQQRNLLLYLGIAGAAGTAAIAGRHVYNKATQSANPVASDHNSLFGRFHEVAKQFNSLNNKALYTNTQINRIKDIWEIKEQLDALYNNATLAKNSAEASIIQEKIAHINRFLLDKIPTINIYGHNTLNTLSNLKASSVVFNDPTLEKQNNTINDLLAKKKKAAMYARSITHFSNKTFSNTPLTSKELDTINTLEQKISTDTLENDQPILLEQHTKLKKRLEETQSSQPKQSPRNQPEPEQGFNLPEIPAVTRVEHSVSPAPSQETPKTPTISSIPTATQQKVEPIVPVSTQSPSTPIDIAKLIEKPIKASTTATADTKITSPLDVNKLDISKTNEIQDQLTPSAQNDQEQQTNAPEKKERAAKLAQELKNLRPDELQAFSDKIKAEDLLPKDREIIENEIKEKRKSVISSIPITASQLTVSREQTASTEAKTPSRAQAAVPLTTTENEPPAATNSDNRIAHMMIHVTLKKQIEKAKNIETLELIKHNFENTYKANAEPEDIKIFEKIYNKKHAELSKPSETKPMPTSQASVPSAQSRSSESKVPFSLDKLPTIPTTSVRPSIPASDASFNSTSAQQQINPTADIPAIDIEALLTPSHIKKNLKHMADKINDSASFELLDAIYDTFTVMEKPPINLQDDEFKENLTQFGSKFIARAKDIQRVTTDKEATAKLQTYINELSKELNERSAPIGKEFEKEAADPISTFIKTTPTITDTPIIIKNSTSGPIQLNGTYITISGAIKTISKRLEIGATENLPNASNLKLSYYNPESWNPFYYYITERLEDAPHIITLQDTSTGYTYTIVNSITDDPYTLLKVEPTSSYQDIQKALRTPGASASPNHLEKAAYYTQGGYAHIGKRIYDILTTMPAMPIVKDNRGTIASIGDPNAIWEGQQDRDGLNIILQEIQDKLLLEKPAAQQYMRKAFILYLYQIAHKLGHIFDEGTFVIHDNPSTKNYHASAIFAFLANMPDTYRRNATHFTGLYRLNSEAFGHLAMTGTHYYGSPVDLSKESKIWGNEAPKSTILFNRITSEKIPLEKKTQYIPTSLFIKPERHGTENMLDLFWHATDLVRTRWNKWRGSDEDDKAKYSKERVPVAILKAYEQLVTDVIDNITLKTVHNLAQSDIPKLERQLQAWTPDLLNNNKTLLTKLKNNEQLDNNDQAALTTLTTTLQQILATEGREHLIKYNTLDGWGIQKMLQLTDIRNQLPQPSVNNYGPSLNPGDDLIITFAPNDTISSFRKTLDNLMQKPAHNTYPELRYGREVILTPAELIGESSSASSSSIHP